MEDIKVIICRYGEKPSLEEIPNTLQALKDIVGGYIEMARMPFNPDLVVICNEEGKILDLPPTMDLGFDTIHGDFLIAKDDAKGELVSLQWMDIEQLEKELNIKLD